jgi:KaiC/GvpD/RAD55 family RecA-like ATPase
MCKNRVPLLLLVLLISIVLQWLLSIGIVASETVAQYYPSEYSLLGNTGYVSGSLADLQSENGSYMIFRSYASQLSAQTLYAHQETTVINNTAFSLLELENPDDFGDNLTASMNVTGRQLWGKFVYPLAGIMSIPSSTWTFHYRTWRSVVPSNVSTNSPHLSETGTWTNSDEAFTSNDIYAYTSSNNARQEYGFYMFNIPSTATITKVEVGYEAYTSTNEELGISLSWNGGSTWATEYVTPMLGNADPDAVTWVDFSNSTNWTANKLSDSMFLSRMRAIRVGFGMGYVYVDWLPVRVTYIPDTPSAHATVNILIRKSNGSVRQTLASDVANSSAISTTPQTLLGNYSWSPYAVVNETDYLEIDYYLNVERAFSGATAFLRIDDTTLTTSEQTRLAGIMLPSEYTVEVEFSGSSNTDYLSQLLWAMNSAWSTDSVSVTLQLYSYTLNAYPSSGEGYIAYVSSAVSETYETKSQLLTMKPMDFRDSLGNWKMKIRGVKVTTSQFYFMADLVKYDVTSTEPPDIAISNIKCSSASIHLGQAITINVTVMNEGETAVTSYVTLLCNETQIGKRLVSDLAPGANTKLTFLWNATDVSLGIYTIKAIADTVPGESDTADNILSGGTVTILPVPSENDSSLLPFIIPIGIVAVVGLISGIVLKKGITGSRFAGFDYFNKIIGGEIPLGSSVLITGGPSSGKSTLCEQLAYKYLTEKKGCVFVSYDNLPVQIRKDMKMLGWDLHKYEQEGACIFVDGYSSLAGTSSQEKHSVQQPFALTELGIVISAAWKEINDAPKTLFLDSATSLFTNLDTSRVIGFLQDRGAKTKVGDGIFVFTLAEGTIEPNFANRLEEIVDCIIELDVHEEQGKDLKRIRVKKLRGQSHVEEWVIFRIEPNRGIVFKSRG